MCFVILCRFILFSIWSRWWVPVSMFAGSELYKQIPVDLAPAQRLGLLSRLALRVSYLPWCGAGIAFFFLPTTLGFLSSANTGLRTNNWPTSIKDQQLAVHPLRTNNWPYFQVASFPYWLVSMQKKMREAAVEAATITGIFETMKSWVKNQSLVTHLGGSFSALISFDAKWNE